MGLKNQYNLEFGRAIIEEFKHLVREDSMAELAQSDSFHVSFYQEIAMQEFIQMGYMPEVVSKKMIASRTFEIQMSLEREKETEYSEEEFVDFVSNEHID